MQNKKKKMSAILLILLTSLMLSIVACRTTPQITDDDIEYLYPPLPFPDFPNPIGIVALNDTGDVATSTVTMPLWYYEQIFQYKTQVDAVENMYYSLTMK